MATLFINGKFTAQRTTGVQRVASQLVLALDALLGDAVERWVLLCPPGAKAMSLKNIEVRTIGWSRLPLHFWEQFVLPLVARKGLLLNLAGSAPFFAKRQAALLHDAAVFDQAQAYTAAFVGWYRLLFRRLARRAERLFTVSAFSQARLAFRLGVDASRFTVLPNGSEHLRGVASDDGVLARHGLQAGRFLLAVASANPTKNLPALVAAFACLPAEPSLRLVIVGGRNEQVFADRTVAADPPGVVRTGALDDAPLKALYENALAFVFPSLYEGFGLPPLEAMACGCPVAVARATALLEVCGDAALYFDADSVDAIGDALRRLLSDEPLRERLKQAGLGRAARYRWSSSAASLRAALAIGGSA